jgi:arylsulfatase A-like enzyme/Tfp pilus assembly protein PilF
MSRRRTTRVNPPRAVPSRASWFARPAMAAIAAGALAAAIWWAWPRSSGLMIAPRPDRNVLLITIDTLRADALGSYGGRAATPNLDALARRGARFDFAHAHAVVTLPSHTSILTGRYPFQHGVRDNTGYRVQPGTETLATMLKSAGFATGAFVGGFPLHSRFGLRPGFDMYDDRFGESRLPTEFVMAERPAGAVVSNAVAWIQRQQNRWFTWVHVFDPHAPYTPPPPFDQAYASDPYAGEVAYTDAALGPLLDAARSAATRPTLVIVVSDHGEALGDHGEETHGLFAYEATLRVPLIIAELGGRNAEQTSERETGYVSHVPARHIDLLPTVLDAVQLPVSAGLPGRSLLGASGDVEDAEWPSYFEAMSASLNRGWAPLAGVLSAREKYIDLPVAEVYDLADDPGERVNLVDRRLDRTRVLQALLRQMNATRPGGRMQEDPEAVARLRALGYVSSATAVVKTAYNEQDDPKRLVAIDRAIHRGIDLFQDGRLREAAEVYRGIIAQRPDMAIAYLHLAVLHWELAEPRAAIETLSAALRAGVVDPDIETRLGMYLAEAGDVTQALALLERIATARPQDIDALNALGIAQARARQRTRALATFRAILAVDADNAMALQNIGSLHLEGGDLVAARQAFERAIASHPRWAAAYTGLGVVELKSGNRGQAIAEWKRAVELDMTEFDALYNLATELAMDDPSAARPYIERFIRTAPPAYAPDVLRLKALLASIRPVPRPGG